MKNSTGGRNSESEVLIELAATIGGRSLDVIVGIADMKVSDDAGVTLVTHSVGSSIGVAVYDPQATNVLIESFGNSTIY